MAAIITRIAEGRTSISFADLLDACLYEIGSLELSQPTRDILVEELGADRDIPCGHDDDREGFEQAAAEVFRLIAAAREYQLS